MNNELQEYLDSCAQAPAEDGLSSFADYRVERLLGFSDFEETQLVYRVLGNARSGAVEEEGPFVRKIIAARSSGALVYEMLFEVQKRGIGARHIPAVIDCFHEDESLVVVTDYIEGSSLESAVSAFGPSNELARQAFLSLCDAVTELHEVAGGPIVHRDLKPSNVMISGGEAYLIDLGIARLFKEDAVQDTQQFGTRAYAPPEQFGFGQTSVRSDVYALGMVLYFCLTGCQPPASMVDMARPEEIPAPLWDVITTATKFDPDQRFATVSALKAAAEWAFGPSGADDSQEPRPLVPALSKGEQALAGPVAPTSEVAPAACAKAVPAYKPAAEPSNSRPSQQAWQQVGQTATSQSGGTPQQHPLWQRVLSKIWNIFLICVAGLLWVGTFASIAHPAVPETPPQTAIRLLECVGLLTLPVSLLAYGLADLRARERFPLAQRSWLSRLGFMFKIALVVFLVTAFFSYAITPTA